MANADQLASAGVYITPDVGVEVTDGVHSRVQVGKITTTPTYGIKVVSSDGTTVIIDGTSDVFKIQTSGTQSVTEGTGAGGLALSSVTLSGLGTASVIPATLAFVAIDSAVTTANAGGNRGIILVANAFSASSSGAAATQRFLGISELGGVTCALSGSPSGNVIVTFVLNNATGASASMVDRYYVLLEAAF